MSFDLDELHYPLPWDHKLLLLLFIIVLFLALAKAVSIFRKVSKHGMPAFQRPFLAHSLPAAVSIIALALSYHVVSATSAEMKSEVLNAAKNSFNAYWIWRRCSDCTAAVWLTLASCIVFLLLCDIESLLERKHEQSKPNGT